MLELKGKPVCGGIAIGKIVTVHRIESRLTKAAVEDTGAERRRFDAAFDLTMRQLKDLYEKALSSTDEASARIFDIHQMMLSDSDFLDSIYDIIESRNSNAEYAVAATAENFAAIFSSMDDDYMKARAADVKDISKQLIGMLTGAADVLPRISEPSIIVADDLSPSETVQLDKNLILAIVTKYGSTTSHTAILSRVMNIPAVVGVSELEPGGLDGKEAIVDGETGALYISPDHGTSLIMEGKAKGIRDIKERLKQLRGRDNLTIDGKHIDIFANIGGLGDIDAVLENDAGGVGLFRSEFLYLGADGYPTEDEQFIVYKTLAERLGGGKVIIRTLDIGADKQIGYFGLKKEENPALGYRAIRICLDRPEIFTAQLRAIYRASAYGSVAIMFPMITSIREILEIKAIIADVTGALQTEGVKLGKNVEIGVMIETPAAALISDLLAEEVDFFSIGTNDLTQYMLAVDRQNPKLDKYYDPHHTALLRVLKLIVDNARKKGVPVGICGELAADPELTGFFLAIGIDELSVAPGKVMEIREQVLKTNTTQVNLDDYLCY